MTRMHFVNDTNAETQLIGATLNLELVPFIENGQ